MVNWRLNKNNSLFWYNLLLKNMKKNRPQIKKDLGSSSLEEVRLVNIIEELVGSDNIRYLESKQLPHIDFEELYAENPEVFEWIKELVGPRKAIQHDFEVRDLGGDWKRAEYFGFSRGSGESSSVVDLPKKTEYDKQKIRYYISKVIKKHFFDAHSDNALFFEIDDIKNKNQLLSKLVRNGIIGDDGKAYGTI